MSEVVIHRDGRPWSTWNFARFQIESRLRRGGADLSEGSWEDNNIALRFHGSADDCELVGVAVDELGLRVERVTEKGR